MATAPNLHYIDTARDGQNTNNQQTRDHQQTTDHRQATDSPQTAGSIRRLKQLSIKARLTLLICLLCALIIGVGALGIYGMSSSNRGMLSVYEDRVVPLADMVTIIDSLNRIRIHAIEAANTSSQAVVSDAIAGTRELDIEIDESWARILATHQTPETEILSQQFQEALRAYRESREITLGLASEGDFTASRANAVNDAGPKYRVAHDVLTELVELETTVAAEQYRNGEAMFKVERNITVAAILVALVLGASMGLLLVRAITKPLTRMTAYLGEIAKGNLTNAIDIHARDEIGLALESLASTQATQRDLVDDIKRAVESINTASVQIAAGNADLSHRTEEQAASLEETAASMEQVSATIKNNADNTAQANQIAKQASQGAETGGEKNRLALDKMQELAASSDQITGIISVINNIAFQTNILALNASVEAARAGDQGRGFAVVATEVRNLAQRSAEAAKEIQQLINLNSDIVRDSNNFVGEAGQAMDEILTRIRQVTDLMAEITRASEEQSQSIEQVRVAVTEMDQVTQQNAALVEESAAAAASLDDQARALTTSVSVFRTDARRA